MPIAGLPRGQLARGPFPPLGATASRSRTTPSLAARQAASGATGVSRSFKGFGAERRLFVLHCDLPLPDL